MSLDLSAPLPGYLFGLTLSNDGTSPNTTIDVAAGLAADDTTTWFIQLTSATTKVLQSSGSWSSGGGGNGLDTGARAASTWYNVFLIRADETGTPDILFSTSFSSPTMPSGYSYKRRIGAIRTDGSSNILAFTQTGDEFVWYTAVFDVNAAHPGTTSTLYSLTVPPDVKVLARVRVGFVNSASAAVQCVVRSPDENSSQVTGFSSGSGFHINTPAVNVAGAAEALVRTNTSQQVAAISNSASNNNLWLRTVGWFDERGRLS